MSKTEKQREEFDKRFLVKKGYLEPDGDKVIFTYDGKKEKKFALVRGGYDELWDWIEKALAQKEAEVLERVLNLQQHTLTPLGGLSNIKYISTFDIQNLLNRLKNETKK